MKSTQKLVTSARVTWSKAIEYCRAQWRLRGRKVMLVGCYVAAVGLIVLLAIVVLRRQPTVHSQAPARSDHEEARRTERGGVGEPRPTGAAPATKGESGSSKSRR